MAATSTFIWAKNRKWLSKCNLNIFFCIRGSRLLNFWFLYNLVAETHISGVYLLSSTLYVIVKSKMDVILHINNWNKYVALNNKHIKAC